MEVREMSFSDLDSVTKIHNKAFDGFFLTRMGASFVRAYYQTILDFEDSIALVAHDPDNNRTLGFVAGFHKPQDFYDLLRQRRRHILPAILLAVLRHPGLLPQIVRNTLRVEANAQNLFDTVELSSIAVGEPGRGIGGKLLKAFANKAYLEGGKKIILTTDSKGNDSVRRFYEDQGFTLNGVEKRGQRELSRYVLELG